MNFRSFKFPQRSRGRELPPSATLSAVRRGIELLVALLDLRVLEVELLGVGLDHVLGGIEELDVALEEVDLATDGLARRAVDDVDVAPDPVDRGHDRAVADVARIRARADLHLLTRSELDVLRSHRRREAQGVTQVSAEDLELGGGVLGLDVLEDLGQRRGERQEVRGRLGDLGEVRHLRAGSTGLLRGLLRLASSLPLGALSLELLLLRLALLRRELHAGSDGSELGDLDLGEGVVEDLGRGIAHGKPSF